MALTIFHVISLTFPHIHYEYRKYNGILSVPHTIVIELYNVLIPLKYRFSIKKSANHIKPTDLTSMRNGLCINHNFIFIANIDIEV